MSTQQIQFNLFIKTLDEKSDIDVSDDQLKEIFKKAFFDATKDQVMTTKNTKTTKKQSGYTVFLSKKMGKGEGQLTMGEAVAEWKSLQQSEKDTWNTKAKNLSGESNIEKENKKQAKPHKKSGYNLFMSHKMKIEKVKMGEAVSIWKNLDIKEKDEWKNKAVEYNAGNN